MSGFLEAEIAHFLLKNLPNRATISSIFKQKLNNFICREIPPDLIRGSLSENAPETHKLSLNALYLLLDKTLIETFARKI